MMEQVPPIPYEMLPLGFRFHPTGEQLINHYLKRKLNGTIGSSETSLIPEINLRSFEPWDLVRNSNVNFMYKECFFFARIDRKYKSGNRWNRATEKGYWKPTGKDRSIRLRKEVIGMKKTLVFHVGIKGKGVGTGWKMHEYRVAEDASQKGVYQGEFVLCRLFKKEKETEDDVLDDGMEANATNLPNHVSSYHDKLLVPQPLSYKTTNLIRENEKQQLSHSTVNTTSDLKEDNMFEVLFTTPTNIESTVHEITNEPIEEMLDKLLEESNSTPDTLQPEKNHTNFELAAISPAYNQVPVINQEESLFDGLKDFLGSDYQSSLIPDDNIKDDIIDDNELIEDSVATTMSDPVNHNAVSRACLRVRRSRERQPRKHTPMSFCYSMPNPMVNDVPTVTAADSNNKDDTSEHSIIESVRKQHMADYGTNVDVNVLQCTTLVQDANTGNSLSKLRIRVGVLVILALSCVVIWLLKKYV